MSMLWPFWLAWAVITFTHEALCLHNGLTTPHHLNATVAEANSRLWPCKIHTTLWLLSSGVNDHHYLSGSWNSDARAFAQTVTLDPRIIEADLPQATFEMYPSAPFSQAIHDTGEQIPIEPSSQGRSNPIKSLMAARILDSHESISNPNELINKRPWIASSRSSNSSSARLSGMKRTLIAGFELCMLAMVMVVCL